MSDRITAGLGAGLFCLGLFLFAAPAQATFIGTEVSFTFIEPPLDDTVNAPVTVSETGVELYGGDGSAIDLVDILFDIGPEPTDGDYIDIGMDFIEFKLFAGGSDVPGLGRTLSFITGAAFRIDFDSDVLALFETPSLDATNMVSSLSGGVPETELMLTSASSLMLFWDTLVVTTGNDFGTLRLDFELRDTTPNPIPVPAALPLMLSALAALGLLARRRRPV